MRLLGQMIGAAIAGCVALGVVSASIFYFGSMLIPADPDPFAYKAMFPKEWALLLALIIVAVFSGVFAAIFVAERLGSWRPTVSK